MTAQTNDSKFTEAKWIVSASLSDGATHTTIASAITSASSGDTIAIKPGTYNENITLKSGVNLCGYVYGPGTSAVIINGKISAGTATNACLENIQFITNADYFYEDTGSASGTHSFFGCVVNFDDNDAININNANRVLIFYNCILSRAGNSFKLFNVTTCSSINFRFCIGEGQAFTPVASTIAAGTCGIRHSVMGPNPLSCSSTGKFEIEFTSIELNTHNLTSITTAGNQTSTIRHFDSSNGTAAAISVGSGTTLILQGGNIFSSNANPITGLGTLRYAAVQFLESGNGIDTSTTSTGVLRVRNAQILGGSITGITDLAVADGGTGASSLTGVLTGNGASAFTASTVTQFGTVVAGASNSVSSVAPSATSGVPYISQGAASNPAFGTAVVAGGGTGITSATAYAVLCGGTSSTGPFQSIAGVGTSGQVLTSNGAAALPTFQDATGGAVVLISTGTASNSAAVAFTGLSSTYFMYIVHVTNLAPASDGVDFYMRTSTDNGASYDSGASDYRWSATTIDMTTTASGSSEGDETDAQIIINNPTDESLGNGSNENASFTFRLYNPSLAKYCHVDWFGQYVGADGTGYTNYGSGARMAAADVDAIQFTMSSGNISTGTFKLYGMKAA